MTEKKMPRADHSGVLKIGDVEIPCYVLDDGRRVLAQTALIEGVGLSKGGSSRSEGGSAGDRLARFVGGKRLLPYVSAYLASGTISPIVFRLPTGGTAHGYQAGVLTKLCGAVGRASAAGVLQKQQRHIAERCALLMAGIGEVGEVALVDEATGYQRIRGGDALQELLRRYISIDCLRWEKLIPQEFYRELSRLWSVPYHQKNRPGFFGRLTVRLLYEPLVPGALDEMQRLARRNEEGRLIERLHQHLSEEIGRPDAMAHIGKVVTLLQAAPSRSAFWRSFHRVWPKRQAELPLVEQEDIDPPKKTKRQAMASAVAPAASECG